MPIESSKTVPNKKLPSEECLLSVLCPEYPSCETIEPLYEDDIAYVWNIRDIIDQAQYPQVTKLKSSPRIREALTYALKSHNHLGLLLFLNHICASEMAHCISKNKGCKFAQYLFDQQTALICKFFSTESCSRVVSEFIQTGLQYRDIMQGLRTLLPVLCKEIEYANTLIFVCDGFEVAYQTTDAEFETRGKLLSLNVS